MKKHIQKNWDLIILVAVFVLMIFMYTMNAFARAGGGGGGGGDGGDGDILDLIFLVIYILSEIPFPWNFVVLGIVFFLLWLGNRTRKQQTVLNRLPARNMSDTQKVISRYRLVNPDFEPEAFKAKVKQAFIEIQEAWQLKNMARVRKYISDGMYQRLNIQFKMMDILDQKNIIENLEVKNIYIDKIENDGSFDIIHVAVYASVTDRFISSRYPQLNNGGSEEFVEYWSFIKKKGVKEVNLFNTQNCPRCGAELPKNAGDVSQCSFCKTFTNLGDYDWILSEITQADDYINVSAKVSKESSLAQKVNELEKSNEDFSIQNIEDKASNGYLQIMTARVLKDPKIMRRFVSEEAYQKLSVMDSRDIVYNRFYLNDVTLIGASQTDNKNILSVAIKSSFQRVVLKDGKASLVDPVVMTQTEVVVMCRDITPQISKGSLYAHSCPSCGGAVKDTIDISCQYCGAELNSTKNEWIITAVYEASDYKNYVQENKDDIVAGIDIGKLESLYDVRDYAFNNVLVVMGADGKFEQQELDMAQRLAKKWGYKPERISPMFDMAKSGGLVLRMPQDSKKRQKIFRLMEKAAAIDGMVSAKEQELLENIKKQYFLVERAV